MINAVKNCLTARDFAEDAELRRGATPDIEFIRSVDRSRVSMRQGREALKLRDAFVERLQPISSMVSPVSPCLAIHTGPGLLGAIVQEVL